MDEQFQGKSYTGSLKGEGKFKDGRLKDFISREFDKMRDGVEISDFSWKTFFSGVAILGCAGTIAFLRRGKSKKFLNMSSGRKHTAAKSSQKGSVKHGKAKRNARRSSRSSATM